MKPGGTSGGSGLWLTGFVLAAVGLYLLFDSVRVTTGGSGLVSGWIGGGRGDGLWETTSMGIVFVPFLLSMIALFVNAKQRIAWWGLYASLGLIAIEMFSRVRFLMSIKTTHLLLMLGLFAAGCGLMIRAYVADRPSPGGG